MKTGNRLMVRKHIKEEHLIATGKTSFNEKNKPSPITKSMGVSG
jgi:hypothetical protein